MKYLLTILCVCLGIVLAVLVLVLVIYSYFVSKIGKSNMNSLLDGLKNWKEQEKEEYARPKNVGGMTSLLEPQIQNDFKDFNKEMIFTKTRTALTQIHSAIESKNLKKMSDPVVSFIKPKVEAEIEKLNEQNKTVEYKDIVFNKLSIKDYIKNSGTATIEVNVGLGYFYSSSDENEKQHDDVRKQTRYRVKFIYVYDDDLLPTKLSVLGVNCPNCGGPIDFMGQGTCSYCGTGIEPINMKAWKVIDYEEY